MQNQKKNLWLVALAGALTIAFVGGCPGDGDSTTGSGSNTGSVTEKNVKIREGKKLAKGTKLNFTGNIDEVAVSGNGNWFYFTSNGKAELHAADLSGKFVDIANDAKWEKIGLGDTGLADTVGKKKMAAAVIALNMASTKEGVLVGRSTNVNGTTDNAANGIAYLKGKAWEAAWINDAGTNIDGLTATEPVFAGVVVSGNNELPVAFNKKTDNFGALDERVTLAAPAVMIDRTLKPHTNPVFTTAGAVIPHVVMVGTDAFIVDQVGVHKLLAAGIAAGANKVTQAQVQAATPNSGSDAWKQTAAVANIAVNDVVAANGKVYIALNGGAANTGGYVVFDPAGPSVKAPDNTDFNNKAVLGFAVEGNNVYAVMDDGLFATDISAATAKKGKKFEAGKALPSDVASMNETDEFFEGTALPSTGIKAAKFAKGGGLVVVTASDIHVIMPVETVKKK